MILVTRSAKAALAAVLLAITGCGTPGPPQPPSLNLPDRVDNLTAIRTGNQVTLTWTMPKRNTDRLPLKLDVSAKICRSEPALPCVPVTSLPFAPASTGSFTEKLPASLATGAHGRAGSLLQTLADTSVLRGSLSVLRLGMVQVSVT